MKHYKIYVIDAQNQISRSYDFECNEDGPAIDKANILRESHAVEVWQSTRLVTRIESGGSASKIVA
jgi:hypothetical protein